jgi:hypothetical protein
MNNLFGMDILFYDMIYMDKMLKVEEGISPAIIHHSSSSPLNLLIEYYNTRRPSYC